jgi:hypothetical protein
VGLIPGPIGRAVPSLDLRPARRTATRLLVPILGLLAFTGAFPAGGFVVGAPLPHVAGPTGVAEAGHVPAGSIVGGPSMFPPNRPLGVPALEREQNISPNDSYTSEPAPMGIADVGLTPSGAAYSYYTPVFVGNVTIHSLETSLTGSGTRYMTFQLNVEVVLQNGSNRASYWIQDVTSIDSASRGVGFLDNVWNFSAGTGAMNEQSVAGNGSIAPYGSSDWYSDGAGSGYPGNDVTLSFPANISSKVVASTISGTPHVSFEYNDGYGWVTFDNVSFPFAHGWTNLGFYVTGTQYVPLANGLVYDAEWDFTGSGAGQQNVNSTLDMGLQYWNGHNDEAVRSAFNHGFNTGESLSNVVSSFDTDPSNGLPCSHDGNGAGTLGPLYGPTDVSDLRVTMPAPSGTLDVNGVGTAYVGGLANLTLPPGSYWLEDFQDGSLNASANVTLSGGQTLSIVLSPIPLYPATLSETGLPAGTEWSATIGVNSYSSSSAQITADLPSGSYLYSIQGVPGYELASYHGTILVGGNTSGPTVAWNQTLYPVQFEAFNLVPGATWTLTVGTVVVTVGSATVATVSLPNGTFEYSISASTGTEASPSSGPVTVQGEPTTVDVSFSIGDGWLTGRVTPADAAVVVDGSSVATQAGSFNVSLAAGAYEVVFELSGYAAVSRNVTITAGVSTSLSVSLTPAGSGGTTSTPSGVGSLSATDELGLVAGLVVAVAAVLTAVLLIRRRPPTLSP